MRKYITIIVIAVFFGNSCLKKEDFSDIPEITYKEMFQVENSLVIKFSFQIVNSVPEFCQLGEVKIVNVHLLFL